MSQQEESAKSVIGQHYLYPVSQLYEGNKLKTEILSEEHFLYRWWFPSDSLIVRYLDEYLAEHPEDVDMQYVRTRIKKKQIGETTYYALYFGAS